MRGRRRETESEEKLWERVNGAAPFFVIAGYLFLGCRRVYLLIRTASFSARTHLVFLFRLSLPSLSSWCVAVCDDPQQLLPEQR